MLIIEINNCCSTDLRQVGPRGQPGTSHMTAKIGKIKHPTGLFISVFSPSTLILYQNILIHKFTYSKPFNEMLFFLNNKCHCYV